MSLIVLPAHFDGKIICLDEPYQLKPNSKLIVTVLPEKKTHDEHDLWLSLSEAGLSKAYGNNEPGYSNFIVKEKNPSYEGRWYYLHPLPQADGKIKNRPALILAELPGYGD